MDCTPTSSEGDQTWTTSGRNSVGGSLPTSASSSFLEDISASFSGLSKSQETPGSLLSPTRSPCLCVSSALAGLENVEKFSSGLDRSTFDRVLLVKKKTISECNLILDCNTCVSHSSSTFVMLLAVICTKLIMSFEKWANQYNGRRPSSQSALGDTSPSQQQSNGKRFFLGVYEVDSTEEQCSLLRSLALVQLRNLRHLLNRLRSIALSAGWLTHEDLLKSLDSRVQATASRLMTREPARVD